MLANRSCSSSRGLSILEALSVLTICVLLVIIAGPVLLNRLDLYKTSAIEGVAPVTVPKAGPSIQVAPIPEMPRPVPPKLPAGAQVGTETPQPAAPAPAPAPTPK